MLEEIKPKVITHPPHAHHAQRAFQMMTTNIEISAQWAMQPSVEIFVSKRLITAHSAASNALI